MKLQICKLVIWNITAPVEAYTWIFFEQNEKRLLRQRLRRQHVSQCALWFARIEKVATSRKYFRARAIPVRTGNWCLSILISNNREHPAYLLIYRLARARWAAFALHLAEVLPEWPPVLTHLSRNLRHKNIKFAGSRGKPRIGLAITTKTIYMSRNCRAVGITAHGLD